MKSLKATAFFIVCACLVLVASRAATAQPLPTSQPGRGGATAMLTFAGTVVDDETGQPVETFSMQTGSTSPADGETHWGGMQTSASRRPGGRFQQSIGTSPLAQRKITFRIIADGYIPQPVTAEPVLPPARLTELVVRLRRGAQIHGVVVDSEGKPVPGAKLYIAGNQPLSLADGLPDRMGGTPVTAGADGRFALSGITGGPEQKIVAMGPNGRPVTLVTKIDPVAEMKIELPKPATLVIRYDILGADAAAPLELDLSNYDKPEWRSIRIQYKPTIQNQGTVELTGLTPGTYDLWRTRELRIGSIGRSGGLDRDRKLNLEPGKTTEVSWVRSKGQFIHGEVLGMVEANLEGAYIYVYPGDLDYDPRDFRSTASMRQFDAQVCGPFGTFETCMLEPGTYTVVVEAYATETPDSLRRSGIRLPSQVGTAKVTIPPDAPPEPLTMKLHPIGDAPTTRPR